MEIESSVKLRNALRKQTRKTRYFFDLGLEMHYTQNDVKMKGPDKVIVHSYSPSWPITLPVPFHFLSLCVRYTSSSKPKNLLFF